MFNLTVTNTKDSMCELVIGSFREEFRCTIGEVVSHLSDWKTLLKNLAQGQSHVFLIYDPRFAWAFYRDQGVCYIQNVMALDGDFSHHSVRDSSPGVSEWSISVEEIKSFLMASEMQDFGIDV